MTNLQIIYKTFDFTSNREVYRKAVIPFNEETMIYDGRLSFRDNTDEFLEGTMNKGIIFIDENTAISVLSIISFSKFEDKKFEKFEKVENLQSSNVSNQTSNNIQNQNKKNFKKRYGRRPHFENKPVQSPAVVGNQIIESNTINTLETPNVSTTELA